MSSKNYLRRFCCKNIKVCKSRGDRIQRDHFNQVSHDYCLKLNRSALFNVKFQEGNICNKCSCNYRKVQQSQKLRCNSGQTQFVSSLETLPATSFDTVSVTNELPPVLLESPPVLLESPPVLLESPPVLPESPPVLHITSSHSNSTVSACSDSTLENDSTNQGSTRDYLKATKTFLLIQEAIPIDSRLIFDLFDSDSTSFLKQQFERSNLIASTPNQTKVDLPNILSTSNSSLLSSNPSSDSSLLLTSTHESSSGSSSSSHPSDSSFMPSNIEPLKDIKLPISRTHSTNRKCVICTESSLTGMVTISDQHVAEIFFSRRLIATQGTRACPHHFDSNGKLLEDAIDQIVPVENETVLSKLGFDHFIDAIRMNRKNNCLTKWEQFANSKLLKAELCLDITGLCLEKFQLLLSYAKLGKKMYDNESRSVSQALATYLYRLKSGAALDDVRRLFDLKTLHQVAQYCDSVRAALISNFVPAWLGISRLNRDELYSHMMESAKIFAEHIWKSKGALVTIYDGTYLYIQKSGNHEFQRVTYSEHKHRNLIKPFMAVLPDGFILDCFCMYNGKDNDAFIMEDLFVKNQEISEQLMEKLQHGDVMVPDRGFRNCKKLLMELGFKVKMPSCKLNVKDPKKKKKKESKEEKAKKQKELTLEANKSRFVTKLRWVVEMVNDHLKTRFKLLDKVISNKSLDHVKDDIRIASALYNFTFKPAIADGKSNRAMAEAMVDRFRWFQRNSSSNIVTFAEEQSKKRKEWEKHLVDLESSTITDFPRLSLETIYNEITFGVYQLKQGLQYVKQHMKRNEGKYRISLFSQDSYIRAEVQSRFSGNKTRHVYIKYKPNVDGRGGIEDWCCDCPNGLRTVGCCGHVTSLIYFLSNAQYLPKLPTAIRMDNPNDATITDETIIWDQLDEEMSIFEITNNYIMS